MSEIKISVTIDGLERGFEFETDKPAQVAQEIAQLVGNTLTAAGGFSIILPPVSEGADHGNE